MSELDENKVSAEQPEEPVKAEETVVAEQPEQAQPVTEQQQQEAAVAEKPKWVKMVELISVICITAAGLLSALFMCLLSYKAVVGTLSQNFMLTDVVKNIQNAAKEMISLGSSAGMEELGGLMATVLSNAYIMMAMIMGIITGIILGIMLIIKTIKQFAAKKETALEKTAITSCLFLFADSAILLSLVTQYSKGGGFKVATEYGSATLAGLIICGILFAVYFICKVVANYKLYLGDKKALINGCMNLGWAVVAMLVLALLTCAPVAASQGGVSVGYSFNYVFSNAFGQILKKVDSASDELIMSLAKQYSLGAVGMVIQIWFIFQSGKSLHGAMRGTVSADKTVRLGSQIWRLVFAVLYLIISAVLTKEVFEGVKANLAAPIVILVFAVVGLVLAIVNKVLVKDKVEKKDI